ncbi:MAG TPA: ATPase domain-containing protein [Candidatus Norongarragalinales archaeon]|nr:ATPase domain-containing protein [Candidatus Norongarragalinales archaeon]
MPSATTKERVPTGIYGLDDLIQGGFIKSRTILVSGSTGTGKSIFSLQWIYRGAAEYNEPGVYVTFDEAPDKIRQDMLNFGWNISELEKKGKIAIVDAAAARAGLASEEENALMPGSLDFEKVLLEILNVARRIGATRIAIDSVASMAQLLETETQIRRNILRLSHIITKSGLTAVITSEVPAQPIGGSAPMRFSKHEVEEYVADGVILLNFLGVGESATRTIYIRKMRGTKHSLEMHPFEITDKGVVVKKIEEVFR